MDLCIKMFKSKKSAVCSDGSLQILINFQEQIHVISIYIELILIIL